MVALTFPQVRIGDVVRCGSLQVFPLFVEDMPEVPYRLPEAGANEATITEVGSGGTVPHLEVENHSDALLLILEGWELVGAKQNRVMNTTVLVKPKTKIKVPVSCVEAGRWHYQTRWMSYAEHIVPNELRHELKRGVYHSLKAKRGHYSDQSAVWHHVALACWRLDVESPTGALAEAYEKHCRVIEDYVRGVPYVAGAVGLAVALAGKVRSVDLFGSSQICSRMWSRLTAGFSLDAIGRASREGEADVDDVVRYWTRVTELPWEAVETVGEGQEFRAASERGDQGSALFYDDRLVYLSVVSPSRN
jgi:hypothetical protein